MRQFVLISSTLPVLFLGCLSTEDPFSFDENVSETSEREEITVIESETCEAPEDCDSTPEGIWTRKEVCSTSSDATVQDNTLTALFSTYVNIFGNCEEERIESITATEVLDFREEFVQRSVDWRATISLGSACFGEQPPEAACQSDIVTRVDAESITCTGTIGDGCECIWESEDTRIISPLELELSTFCIEGNRMTESFDTGDGTILSGFVRYQDPNLEE